MFARTLYKAREQFLSQGELAKNLQVAVRPEILRSWQRSKRSGARFDLPALPYTLDEAPDTPLTVATDPVISRLAEQLSDMCAGVLLSDRSSRIVRRWAPDLKFLCLLDQTASDVGFSGSEEFIGTNGIGTATEERQPRIVVGPEHFADVLTTFTCVGVPICHPISRRFEGVITLSARADAASPLLLPFFTGIAHEIEQQLLEQATPRERSLLDAFLTASGRGRPVAVIGADVLITGPKAARLLRGADPTEAWPRLAEELALGRGPLDTQLDAADGPVTLRCEPLRDGGRLIGALIHLTPPSDDHEPAAAERMARLAQQIARAGRQRGAASRWAGTPLVGHSPAWTAVLAAAAAHVHSSDPVLLAGEAGTGKTALTRAMHSQLGLPEERCTVLDCAAAPDYGLPELVEAALAARNDTLVLQHIDALALPAARAVSAKLEAHLATGAPPRVMATTTPVVHDGAYAPHQRLLDVLGVLRLDLPPLRARTEDVPELVAQIGQHHAGSSLMLSQKAMVALKRAPWPGNVRQLETVVRALSAAAAGREITVEMLPPEIAVHSKRRHLTAMEQVELEAILSALGRSRGNKVLAARDLGISRSTLYRKMASYLLDPDLVF
ncbi:MAG: sigma-54-dependent Fis family transcriptional regulator, partial [Nitrososphaerales archaeon]